MERIIDGDSDINGCGLGLKQCNRSAFVPMQFKFVGVRAELKSMLKSTSNFGIGGRFEFWKTTLNSDE